MAVRDGENGNAWIEKVRSEGSVPCLPPENCPNGWATPPGDLFMVRGPNYLSDKVKIPGGQYLLESLGFDWIKGSKKIGEVLNNPNHRVRKAIDEAISRGKKPFVWAFNLQLPSKDNNSAIAYFIGLEPIEDGSLIDQFIKSEDTFRNSRLKLIANIVQGPWIVKKAVGEQAICILGRALACRYVVGSNYIEVDVDIASSVIANAIVHLAFGYITSLTVDLAFLIESQTEAELPERIIGAVRFSELTPDSASQYEMSAEENFSDMQSSQPSLWRSLGCFTHLLHRGNQDGSVEHINDTLDVEDENVFKLADVTLKHEDGNEHAYKYW